MKQESGLNSEVQFSNVSDIPISDISLLHENGQHRIFFATSQGRRVILKAVNHQNQHAEWLEHLLTREFQLLQQIESPFIVRAWQIKEVQDIGRCIIMEYVDGVSLNEYLETRPTAKQRKQILCELTEALSYLHSKQMVHGDIKPQNILIARNGSHAKLIDLGLTSKDEYVSQNVGYTDSYAAPEQRGAISSPIDERTDVYALGHIIKLLFPYKYRSVYRKCLRREPSRRYESVNDVKRALTLYPLRWCVLILILILLGAALVLSQKRQSVTPTMLNIPNNEAMATDTISVCQSSKDTLPVIEQKRKSQSKKKPVPQQVEQSVPTQAIVQEVEPDPLQSVHQAYRQLYEAYFDSITSMPYQYQDFGMYYIHSFARAINTMHLEYKSQYEDIANEIEEDYVSQYGIYYPLLASHVTSLPDLWVSYQKGNLTEKEYERLHKLVRR